MQHHSNPKHPLNIGGVQKKGMSISEDALIQIVAGLCANPEAWNKSSEEIVNKAKEINQQLFAD